MRVVFEGTEEQIDNLKKLSKLEAINLPTLREDLHTSNLWSINDVKHYFECSDSVAMDIIVESLLDANIIESINEKIKTNAEKLNLKEKQSEVMET